MDIIAETLIWSARMICVFIMAYALYFLMNGGLFDPGLPLGLSILIHFCIFFGPLLILYALSKSKGSKKLRED